MTDQLNVISACGDGDVVGVSFDRLGLNEMYVWFLLPTYPNFLTLP